MYLTLQVIKWMRVDFMFLRINIKTRVFFTSCRFAPCLNILQGLFLSDSLFLEQGFSWSYCACSSHRIVISKSILELKCLSLISFILMKTFCSVKKLGSGEKMKCLHFIKLGAWPCNRVMSFQNCNFTTNFSFQVSNCFKWENTAQKINNQTMTYGNSFVVYLMIR